VISPAGRADAGAYLARLVRLDPAALVRLRPVASGVAQLWAMLPFGVLVVRRVPADDATDVTVAAAELLATLSDDRSVAVGSGSGGSGGTGPVEPRRRDEAWRWALPPARSEIVERIPAAAITAVARAASRTLRAAVAEGVGGRRVGERIVRDALLDHVAIVATGQAGVRAEVPQRLVQALVRMGFVQDIDDLVTESERSVTVRSVGGWVGLDGSYGSAWYRPSSPLRFA
jgi:hypothetical protein